jgi:hypothetical protein
MNGDELKRIWKEVIVASSRYHPCICLEELRKITNNLSRDSRCPNRDSKREPIEYKPRTLLLDQPVQLHKVEGLIK